MIFEKTGHGGDLYGKPVICDLSANINPLGTPEAVRRAVIAAAERIHHYPDPCCRDLIRKIAEHEELPSEYVMCGNGAAELIFSFCSAVRPKRALELAPTFSEYSAALESVGCTVDRYFLKPENGFALTEEILSALETGRWDVLFLCDPNNPTGRLIPPSLLKKICDVCAQTGIRLFLDECFLDLSDDGGAHSMKPFLTQCPGLFILKAFTKNYGMAGLRLGYCLCADRSLLTKMSKTVQVWNVSIPAQAAGIAALDEPDFPAQARHIIARQREILSPALRSMGFEVYPTEANYLLFHSDRPLDDALLKKGILIRNCSNYHGLGENWYRIAIKGQEETELLLAALRQIMGG